MLRGAGVDVPVGSTIDFARALDCVGLDDRERRLLGRAARRSCAAPTTSPPTTARSTRSGPDGAGRRAADEADRPADGRVRRRDADARRRRRRGDASRPSVTVRWSPVETLRDRDFASYTDERVRAGPAADGRPAAHGRAPALAPRASPTSRSHGTPDLRRTVRRSLRAGGEVDAARVPRHRARGRDPLVLLLDVSGSMEPYARAFVRFVHAAVVSRTRVEAFALGHPAARAITRELSSRDPDAAVRAAADRVVDWSGGTRLGEGLRAFNDEWGIRGMARRRDRRDPLRRLGPRRSRQRSPSRWRGSPASRTRSSGSTR